MNLLFKRGQINTTTGKMKFELWSKIELTDDELAIYKRYRFGDAVLILADQPGLFRNSILVGGAGMILGLLILYELGWVAIPLAVIAGVAAGFGWYHQNRETIMVKDLMFGRNFKCDSVVDLARKEAWLETVVSFLRQVMESAKHWDGTERHLIEGLPKEEARQVIIRGL